MGRLGYLVKTIAGMDYGALFNTVGEVHAKCGKSRPWLFFDIVKCGLTYSAGYKDYDRLAFYNLTDEQRATFVTRGINNRIVRLLNDPAYYHYFDDKSEFYATFNEWLHRGWLHFSKSSKQEFLDFMRGRDQIMAKPEDTSGGTGVEKLKVVDFPSLDALYDHLKTSGADLIEDVVIQHPDMAALNPGSVNTVRVFTVLTDAPHAICACVRMGNGDRPVDNFCAGGMFAPVDLKTGKITRPACDGDTNSYESHPHTHIHFVGYQLPLWDQVIDLCLTAAKRVPQMGYVGWDVAITSDGPLFIEGNNLPGHVLFPQTPEQAPDGIGVKPAFQKYLKDL